MALPTLSPQPLSPQVVGNAFVQQYYEVLHRSPELVYRFYQDSSNLSRPDTDGMMSPVTTMQAINDKIVSLDYKNYFAEIETVDSQSSYMDGVFILVTGCLTGGDHIRRKFTQAFFLAPQDKGGYFVLNDIFRFVDETQPREINQMIVSSTSDDAPDAPLTPDPDQDLVQECHAVEIATPISEGDADKSEEVLDLSENGGLGIEGEVVVDPAVNPSQSDVLPVSEGPASIAQEDAPKKSYASIVKVMKGSISPVPTYVPTTKARVTPVNPEKPIISTTKPAPKPETPVHTSNNVPDSNNSHEAEGYSIYIRNLPFSATIEQVEEQFKEFGPIKRGGVQVRSHKVESFCFGFVEFESLDSMQAAIEASPITIGGRKAYIEEKRTTTRVVNGVVTNSGSGFGGRGRFPLGRGGFRNDGFRGRENFRGNQGYGRSEFRNQGEYAGWNRGAPGRASEGYQPRPLQNGNGRVARPNGSHQTAIAA